MLVIVLLYAIFDIETTLKLLVLSLQKDSKKRLGVLGPHNFQHERTFRATKFIYSHINYVLTLQYKTAKCIIMKVAICGILILHLVP